MTERVSENSHSIVGAEETRLQMLWKSPSLAVEEVDLLTLAPPFQTRSVPIGENLKDQTPRGGSPESAHVLH
jgi:hypothetical protein